MLQIRHLYIYLSIFPSTYVYTEESRRQRVRGSDRKAPREGHRGGGRQGGREREGNGRMKRGERERETTHDTNRSPSSFTNMLTDFICSASVLQE
jgi:hypothetical protein